MHEAGTVARDRFGNALGGLRTPFVDVPTATFSATDGSAHDTPLSGLCPLMGFSTPFRHTTLHALYRSHAAYVARGDPRGQPLVRERLLGRLRCRTGRAGGRRVRCPVVARVAGHSSDRTKSRARGSRTGPVSAPESASVVAQMQPIERRGRTEARAGDRADRRLFHIGTVIAPRFCRGDPGITRAGDGGRVLFVELDRPLADSAGRSVVAVAIARCGMVATIALENCARAPGGFAGPCFSSPPAATTCPSFERDAGAAGGGGIGGAPIAAGCRWVGCAPAELPAGDRCPAPANGETRWRAQLSLPSGSR